MQDHVGLSTWPCTIESSHSGGKRSDSSSPAQQVDDENDQSYHQQQMDQASRYMQAEPKQPQNQKHHEDRPKHMQSPSCHVATVLLVVRKLPSRITRLRIYATQGSLRFGASVLAGGTLRRDFGVRISA